MSDHPLVYIIMGSKSDEEKMKKAEEVLKEFEISFQTFVSSAHREPDKTADLIKGAEAKGVRVLIAGAGLAAALPGFAAAYTRLPVIGVPLASGSLNGVDALYAAVQMPAGNPVATVGIDNAKNAAHLAIRILALTDPKLKQRMSERKKN